MDLIIRINTEYQIIRLQSLLPFKMDESKRIEGSIATNYINYSLAMGSFDYNVADGSIAFRLVQSFRNSYISSEICNFIIDMACYTIDRYNDKLLVLSKGNISVSEFIEKMD